MASVSTLSGCTTATSSNDASANGANSSTLIRSGSSVRSSKRKSNVSPVPFVDGLVGPTQVIDGPEDVLVVAQINGDEEQREGQVVAIDTATKKQRLLLSQLDKPTGVAWIDNTLWVMVRRGLVKAAWDGVNEPGPIETVLRDLPFNGRSEGTLTPMSDGSLLYETSGTLDPKSPGTALTGSGQLRRYDPKTGASTVVAIGSKNSYARVLLADGRLAVTEIGDGPGSPPPDEVNIITIPKPDEPPADLGWPSCPSDAAAEAACANVVAPIAVFPPSSTPIGLVVSGDDLYVALWNDGRIVRVPMNSPVSSQATNSETAVDALAGPHTLFRSRNGTIYLTEVLKGRIVTLAL
jgi:glucose/arabinose dehydrogenase